MVGWAKVDLKNAILKPVFGMVNQTKSKLKLPLFGQSPFGNTELPIRTQEDEIIGKSTKDKFLKAFGKKVEVDRYINLELTQFCHFAQ